MKSEFLGYETREIIRYNNSEGLKQHDKIVQELPIALIYNGISHAVMMATPTDIEVFAKGFSLSEGIIASLKDIYSFELVETQLGIQVEFNISSRAFSTLKQQRRQMVGRTGCGLCGIESLQQVHENLKQVTTSMQAKWLNEIPLAFKTLKEKQDISLLTGGAHAAAWVVDGHISAIFEDVGRHNALDKLLGHIAMQNMPLDQGFVLITSRCSYELVKKCVAMNIAFLACLSAPTSLAIQMAKSSGLTLAAFCRGDHFVLYE